MNPADLQILFAARMPRQLSNNDKYYRDFWAIHVVFTARVSLAYDERRFDLQGDWLWTGFPGPHVRSGPVGGLPSLHWRIALSGDQLRRWDGEGLWPREPLRIHDRAAMAACADRVVASLVGDDVLATRLRANAVEALLLEGWRQQRTAVPLPSWILELQQRLRSRWRETPDYTALAKRWHMPLHRLRREFHRATGEAVHTWFLRQRIEEAKLLLLRDDRPLEAIATECGYADRGFFSRQFAKFVGMSPAAFRRAAYA